MEKSIRTLNHDDLSISPKYKVSDWVIARDINNWILMTNIFNDRIEGRYLKPIRLIASDSDIGEFSGFSILAIDCLIIETLNQFYLGLDETRMLTRLDKQKSKTKLWSISTDNKAVFVRGSDIGFTKELMKHDKLLTQITPYGESPVMATFDIRGLTEAIKPLRKTCHW